MARSNTIILNLTDAEWMSLLDGEAEDSQLAKCCANISALRDELMNIVRQGRNDPLDSWTLSGLQQKLGWVADGHELSPLLKKICEQIGFDPYAEEDHTTQEKRHMCLPYNTEGAEMELVEVPLFRLKR